MVAFNKINAFVADVGLGVHNLNTGVMTYALTTTALKPTAGSTNLASITPISYTYLSSRVPTNSGYSQSSGLAKLILQSLVITCGSPGPAAAFGTVVLYNDSAASKQLISWWEYGSDITMLSTETFTISPDTVNGILSLT